MMVQQCGFEPNQVSVAGYAQYRPIASNDSDEGRRKNRRIDLVIVAGPPDLTKSNAKVEVPPAAAALEHPKSTE